MSLGLLFGFIVGLFVGVMSTLVLTAEDSEVPGYIGLDDDDNDTPKFI